MQGIGDQGPEWADGIIRSLKAHVADQPATQYDCTLGLDNP